MSLPSLAIQRPVFAVMLSAVIALFGIVSINKLGIDRLPTIDVPFLTVTTTQVGADPSIVDSSITDVIESAVNSVPGIDYVSSTSLPGASVVKIAFELTKNIDVAFNEVQTKVNQVIASLPRNSDTPIVQKIQVGAEPILWVVLQGNRTLQQLNQYAENDLIKHLQNVDGVGDVVIGGERERTIRVNLDPKRMAALGITPQDIQQAFSREHLLMPGGFVDAGKTERLTRLDLEFHSADDLGQMILSYKNGAPIRLNQVADVVDDLADKRALAQLNGEPAVGLGVIKIQGANTVAIIEEIKQRLHDEIIPALPAGMKISVAADDSVLILDIIHALKEHLWLGTLLAAFVVLLFLKNFRATLIISIAIPVSLLGAVAAMYFAHYTFNVLTLLALILLIGVVVDDSIVVLENVYRHREENEDSDKDQKEIALTATQEVMFAVLASTFTIVSIFVPVVFLGGIIGRFFQSFAVVVVVGVLVSLFVSLTLTPMLCSRYLKVIKTHGKIYQTLESAFVVIETKYKEMLDWGLNNRWKLLAITLAMVIATGFVFSHLGKEFLPKTDEGRFIINFKVPIGSSIDYTQDRLNQIEKVLRKHPEVLRVFTTVGTGALGEVSKGNMYVRLVPREDRELKQHELMEIVRGELANIPGVQAFPSNPAIVGGGRGESLQFVLEGPDLDNVEKFSEQLLTMLRKEKGLGNIDLDTEPNQPQYQLQVDRTRAQSVGLDTQDIVEAMAILGGGINIAKYNDARSDGTRYDIRLKAKEGSIVQPKDLEKIFLRNNTGQLVRMDNVAKLVPIIGPAKITRSDLMYATNFFSAPTIPLGSAVEMVKENARQILPLGYSVQMRGEALEFAKTAGYIAFAFTLAIVLMYMVLASQFNSFIQPITLMLALPLAIVGGLTALWLVGMTLNIYSMIGMVLLMGLVAKNSILLIDLTNQLREQGYGIDEALRRACPLRMRPVVMTSMTIILALLPAAMGSGAGSDTNGPLAVAVIGGMVSSTLLTLVVIPAVYSLIEHKLEKTHGHV